MRYDARNQYEKFQNQNMSEYNKYYKNDKMGFPPINICQARLKKAG